MNKDEEFQRYMIQIEQYKEQLNNLEMQMSYMQSALAEYNRAKITVENLEKLEKETEMIIPLGGGAFINAKPNNCSKVLVDIGAGYVTEKNYEDAVKKIDERIKMLEKTQERIQSMMEQLEAEANELSQKAQKLANEQ
jgi:prefoldin alpha subunit